MTLEMQKHLNGNEFLLNNVIYEKNNKVKSQMRCSKCSSSILQQPHLRRKDFRNLSKTTALTRFWWHSTSLPLLEVIYIHSVRSRGFKSGDISGRDTGPPLPTQLYPKVPYKCCVTAIEKCIGAPSWFKGMSSKISSIVFCRKYKFMTQWHMFLRPYMLTGIFKAEFDELSVFSHQNYLRQKHIFFIKCYL